MSIYDHDNDEIETRDDRPRIRKLQSIAEMENKFTVAEINTNSMITRLRKFLLAPFSVLLKITIPSV